MRILALVIALGSVARAQPVTRPDLLPLAQIRDDKQLAEALATITQDPAVKVDDNAARPLAQALMTEGVKQLQTRSYDQALANFLEAYNKLPSPKILLNIASTLRDMGRLADAANTYQRYLGDPAAGAERITEVKELLIKLDEQLTILTVRVFPRGSEVSIDGGPFLAIGSSLLTRVRPGIHLVRIRKGDSANEVSVNGFEGETKDVNASLAMTVEPARPAPPTAKPDESKPDPKLMIETDIPDHLDGWLITGTQYSAASGTGRERRVRTGYAGPEVAPIVPKYQTTASGEVIVEYPSEQHISSGIVAMMRIDLAGHCCAGGLGVAITPEDHIEVEAAVLHSNEWGAYLGARYRLLVGTLRPYLGAGLPVFVFTNDQMATQVAPGLRAAAGLEVMINGHVSVEGDLGLEHFFNVSGTPYPATVWVPTVGVIGRL